MSFDFQLAHACPHLTIEEEVLLGDDRRELQTRQPVASSSHIRITANDQVTIPSQGLLSNATITGSTSGPFKVIKTENTITVSNRTESVQDVSLPVGTRITTDRVVEILESDTEPLMDDNMLRELRRICELADERHKDEELDFDLFG